MNICLYSNKQFADNYNYFDKPSSLILKIDTCPFGLRLQYTTASLSPSRLKQMDQLTNTTIAVQTVATPLLALSTIRIEGTYTETVYKLDFSLEGEYEGQHVNGKPEGIGRFVPSSGAIYEGGYREGLRNGFGMMTVDETHYFQKWESGCLLEQIGEYRGQFKDGLPHGEGELFFDNQRLKGTFERGVLQGLGTLERFNKLPFVYIGPFLDGLFHGYGQITYKGKLSYEGYFKEGIKEGFGVFSAGLENIFYIGEWSNGLPNGPGTARDFDGVEEYTGTWINGFLEGAEPPIHAIIYKKTAINSTSENEANVQLVSSPLRSCTTYWDDVAAHHFSSQAIEIINVEMQPFEKMAYREMIYVSEQVEVVFNGEWLDGKPHGQGRYTYQDGTEYRGTFINGFKDGVGIRWTPYHQYLNFWRGGRLIQEVGEYTGSALYGKPFGIGSLKVNEEVKLKGFFNDGHLNGHGMIESVGNSFYSGPFVNWLPEGFGTARLPNHDTYVGEFSKGSYEGEGCYTFALGTMEYMGQFKNDMKEGLGKLYGFEEAFTFIGEWKQDLPNGQGSLFVKGGNSFKGIWKEGWLEVDQHLINAWGGNYTGAIQEGLPHGRGTLEQFDSTTIEADFVNGEMSTVHKIKSYEGACENVDGKLILTVNTPTSLNSIPTEVMTPPLSLARPESATPPTSIPDLDSPERADEGETSSENGSQSSDEREQRTTGRSANTRNFVTASSRLSSGLTPTSFTAIFKSNFTIPNGVRPPLTALSLNTISLKRGSNNLYFEQESKESETKSTGEEVLEADKENRLITDEGKRVKTGHYN